MKNLLSNIQARLSDQISYLPMRDQTLHAIFIVPDENDLPPEADFPCFGLKDGPISYDIKPGSRGETLVVTIIGYVMLPEKEASIMGKDEIPGALDLMNDAKNALDNWLPDGFSSAYIVAETASVRLIKMDPTVAQDQWPFLQKKTATFKYWREVIL